MLSETLLNRVRDMLFNQRLTLDTELSLYGTRSSIERKKKSPAPKSKNLIRDSLKLNLCLSKETVSSVLFDSHAFAADSSVFKQALRSFLP